jgi:hypothetical protein
MLRILTSALLEFLVFQSENSSENIRFGWGQKNPLSFWTNQI